MPCHEERPENNAPRDERRPAAAEEEFNMHMHGLNKSFLKIKDSLPTDIFNREQTLSLSEIIQERDKFKADYYNQMAVHSADKTEVLKIMCGLCRIIEKHALIEELPPDLRSWWEEHKKWDEITKKQEQK